MNKCKDEITINKWQSAYYWRSFLVSGETPPYATLDAQVTWNLSNLQSKNKNWCNKFAEPLLRFLFGWTADWRILLFNHNLRPT